MGLCCSRSNNCGGGAAASHPKIERWPRRRFRRPAVSHQASLCRHARGSGRVSSAAQLVDQLSERLAGSVPLRWRKVLAQWLRIPRPSQLGRRRAAATVFNQNATDVRRVHAAIGLVLPCARQVELDSQLNATDELEGAVVAREQLWEPPTVVSHSVSNRSGHQLWRGRVSPEDVDAQLWRSGLKAPRDQMTHDVVVGPDSSSGW